jgi:3-deoxy-D-manno-octulosonate 8-phosphate phosphatase (KDO 8-P phosphatase)
MSSLSPDAAARDSDFAARCRALKLISFDVDGVLTDGKLYYSDDGRELKAFNVQDGAALKLLRQHGVEVAILTGRNSPMVARRAGELGIEHLYQGLEDKLTGFNHLLAKTGLQAQQTAHVGDDLQDLTLFDQVGLAISVPNAHPTVLRRADLITDTAGGQGVARELAERVLKAQGSWPYG